MTPAEFRELAREADRKAFTAPTGIVSRSYRYLAGRYRLSALMAEYRIEDAR